MNDDLISREALIREACVKFYTTPYYKHILDLIDNAPTVEITEEQAIDKLHETGWMQRHDKEMNERPKGKWIKVNPETRVYMGLLFRCSFCMSNVKDFEYAYCPNCGAEMEADNEK